MMKRTGKRAMAILLTLVMLMSLFPMAYAAEGSDAEWEEDIQGVFVNIPAPSYEMEVGESILINDVVVTGDGNLTYEWQSSNSSVVSVNGSEDSATLTAVGAGQATVTLTVNSPTDSGSDSVLITVNEKAVAPVKAQAAGSTSLNLAAGTNQAVSVTATGGSGSYNYRWQGSDGIGVDSSSSRPSNTVYGLYAGTGQVTVTVEDDFSGVDETLVRGKPVHLDAGNVENYVRARSGMREDSTNLNRMKRQRTYLAGLFEALRTALQEDEDFVAHAYSALSDSLVSDCTLSELSLYAERFSVYEMGEIVTPEGEAVKGENFMEFYVDEDSLQELVLRTFYRPVN